jgi:hypothetical protein
MNLIEESLDSDSNFNSLCPGSCISSCSTCFGAFFPLITVAGFIDRVIKQDGVKDDFRSCSFVNSVYNGNAAFLSIQLN